MKAGECRLGCAHSEVPPAHQPGCRCNKTDPRAGRRGKHAKTSRPLLRARAPLSSRHPAVPLRCQVISLRNDASKLGCQRIYTTSNLVCFTFNSFNCPAAVLLIAQMYSYRLWPLRPPPPPTITTSCAIFMFPFYSLLSRLFYGLFTHYFSIFFVMILQTVFLN